ncbi:MAG TPA: hypothetical protein VN420_01485 [Candidatus Fimivivens sp.]|nr:hypothetical protein [Candidatus Fimivivens sp.]
MLFTVQLEQAGGFRTVAVCVFLGLLLLSELMTVRSFREKPIRLAPLFISLAVTVSFLLSLVPEASVLVWTVFRSEVVSSPNLLGEVIRKANLLSVAFLISIVVFWASSYGRPMVIEEYPKAGRRQWLCLLLAAMVTSMAEMYYLVIWSTNPNPSFFLSAVIVSTSLPVRSSVEIVTFYSSYSVKSFRPDSFNPEASTSYFAGKTIAIFGMMSVMFPLLALTELSESVLRSLVAVGVIMTSIGGCMMWWVAEEKTDTKQAEG